MTSNRNSMTKDHQPSEIGAGELEKALKDVILSSIHQGKSVTAEGLGTFRKSHIKSQEKVWTDGRIFLMPPADRIEFMPALGSLLGSSPGSLSGSEKLSANELVRNVSYRLPASEEQTDQALTALAERIQEEVASGGRSDVEGFGVFVRGDENTDQDAGQELRFIPFPSTAIQVNAWNTGMEAVDASSGELRDVTVSDLMEVWDDAQEQQWAGGVSGSEAGGELESDNSGGGSGGEQGEEQDGVPSEEQGGVPGEKQGVRSRIGSSAGSDGGSSDRSDGGDNGEDKKGIDVKDNDVKDNDVKGKDITGMNHLSDTPKGKVGNGFWMILRVAAALAGLGLIGWYFVGHISERMEEGWVVERSVMQLAGQSTKGAHEGDLEEGNLHAGDSHESDAHSGSLHGGSLQGGSAQGEAVQAENTIDENVLGDDVHDQDVGGSGAMDEAGEARLVDVGEGVDASTRKEMEEVSAEADVKDVGGEAGAEYVSTEADAEEVSTEADAMESSAEVSSGEESSAGSLYGLMGGVADVDAGGYCIVLFSLTNESRADRMIAVLSDEGYKTVKMIRITGDGSLYRVAVGQFLSVEEAQAAAELLPEPYRSNHFVTRLE
jgi:nucleoid DNA-binding protein